MNAKKQFVDLNLRNRRTGISLPACLIAVVAGLAALATPPAQAQTFQVLYTFSGGSDGSSPWGVILDAAGNLYGATREGGSTSEGCNTYFRGCGVVFKIDPVGQESVLHSFSGGNDGLYPLASLIQDAAGNLYGTTSGLSSFTSASG